MSINEFVKSYLEKEKHLIDTRPRHIAYPGNTEMLFNEKVKKLMNEELESGLRACKPYIEKGKMTEIEAYSFCFSQFCQNRGARIADSVDKGNLSVASENVVELFTMIELVGGHICPMHEPYVVKYLNMVEQEGQKNKSNN